MFYIIAAVLIVAALFFLYSANSAFVELRHKSKDLRTSEHKKIDVTLDSIDPDKAASDDEFTADYETDNKHVDAKPYMVVLFLAVALILLAVSYAAVSFQPTWEQIWNNFWHITPKPEEPFLSEQTKATIYGIAQVVQPITLYVAITFGALFVLSLPLFKGASMHLFLGAISMTFITFLCFIMSIYTEPAQIADIELNVVESSESISRYLKDKNTDVIMLSGFIKDYFKIPRDINGANVDQLRQYVKGLNEIKQNLMRVEVPNGAETAAKLSTDWINQEIHLVNDTFAAKNNKDFVSMCIRFVGAIKNFFNDSEEIHRDTTKKLQQMRSRYATDKGNEQDDLKSHFSFIR